MSRLFDLKASPDDLIASVKQVADNLSAHVKGYGEEIVEGVRLATAAMPALQGGLEQALVNAEAFVVMRLDLRSSTGRGAYLRLDVNSFSTQGDLHRDIKPGEYTAVVLLLPVKK